MLIKKFEKKKIIVFKDIYWVYIRLKKKRNNNRFAFFNFFKIYDWKMWLKKCAKLKSYEVVVIGWDLCVFFWDNLFIDWLLLIIKLIRIKD